jgi:hypothetical protein
LVEVLVSAQPLRAATARGERLARDRRLADVAQGSRVRQRDVAGDVIALDGPDTPEIEGDAPWPPLELAR